jgi:DNA-binding FadR family transcriptional regulator
MSDDMILTGTECLRVIPRTKPVTELILDEITWLITEAILKPGDWLPLESGLAESFGVGKYC